MSFPFDKNLSSIIKTLLINHGTSRLKYKTHIPVLCNSQLVFPEALTVLCYTLIGWFLLCIGADTPLTAGKEGGSVGLCLFQAARKTHIYLIKQAVEFPHRKSELQLQKRARTPLNMFISVQ